MRFISEDSYKGDVKDPLSLNLYSYCVGNPIKYTDPSGHDAIVITAEKGAHGFGHTSAIFQDNNGNWYYYFWGDTKVTLNPVPNEAMKSLDAFNKWISEGAQTGRDFRGSQYYDKEYTCSTYIEGDFSASIDSIKDQVKDYWDRYGKQSEDNSDYGPFLKNCLGQTQKALKLGELEMYKKIPSTMTIIPNTARERYFIMFKNYSFTYIE